MEKQGKNKINTNKKPSMCLQAKSQTQPDLPAAQEGKLHPDFVPLQARTSPFLHQALIDHQLWGRGKRRDINSQGVK